MSTWPRVIERFGRTLPVTCEQAFDIAADIERYPEFLPCWISARITRRDANICYVDQEVGIGAVRLRFGTTAVMQRPARIDVTSTDESFRHFTLSWSIESSAPEGCRVSLAAAVQLQSGLLQYAVAAFLPGAIEDIILAFEVRACALYKAAPRLKR